MFNSLDGVWLSREQLKEMKKTSDEVMENLKEIEFLLLLAEVQSQEIQKELENAFKTIEELMGENGKLVKTVEDMELVIRKGCACTRVWE